MKLSSPFAVVVLAASLSAAAHAQAEEEIALPALPPPATEVTELPALEAAPAPAEDPAKAEPAPEVKEEPKPEPKPEPKKEEPKAAKAAGPEEEYAFAKAAAEESDEDVSAAAMADLELFVRRHPDAPQAPEALLLLAGLRQKKGDWRPAMTTLLRLLYEYPSTTVALKAKSAYLELVDKKASRKQRSLLSEYAKLPETTDKADRLAWLWARLAEQVPDAAYEPVAAELRDFFVRFPGHKDADKLQVRLAGLHAANGKPAAALLACRKLLALHPGSALRSQAQLTIGDLYASELGDPKKAIDAYQELASRYPSAPEVLPALERSAALFADKLRQYDLAVEMHEKAVSGFPKTAASLAALKAVAKLQRERLGKPADAVKTLARLSAMHGGQDGVDALLTAADWSRRDLKDMARQTELLRKVADDYAAAKEAPQALFDAASVYESDLNDGAKAAELYKELEARFPSHRLAKKAAGRAAKLAEVSR